MIGFFRIAILIVLFSWLFCPQAKSQEVMVEHKGNSVILCEQSLEITDPEHADKLSDLKYYIKLRFPLKATNPQRFIPSISAYMNKQGKKMKKPKLLKKVLLNKTHPYTSYDSSVAVQALTAIENYLYNQGYLKASAKMETQTDDLCAELKYVVTLGPRFVLNQVKYVIGDSSLLPYQWEIEHQSLLKRNAPAMDELFYREGARITQLIKNKGFAFFNASFIRPRPADTFGNRINLTIDIVPPGKDSSHVRFSLGHVEVFADYDPKITHWEDTTVEDIRYHYRQGRKYVIPEVLKKKVKLHPGDIYTLQNEVQTYDGLNRFPSYKLVTLDHRLNKTFSNKLDYILRLSPIVKYEFERQGGLTYSRYSDQQTFLNLRNIIRPSIELSLRNRNFRNRGIGMHYYIIGDTEFYFDKRENGQKVLAINAYNYELGLEATLPNYSGFPGTFDILYRSRLMSPWFFNEIKERARPEFRANLSLLRLPTFYSSASGKVDFGYRFKASDNASISIRTLGLEYYYPQKEASFDTIIRDNEFLTRSILGQRLFSSIFFKYFGYSLSRQIKGTRWSWASVGSLEQSGVELFVVNSFLKGISNKTPDISLLRLGKDTLQFSSFIRFSSDLKMYYHFTRETYLAFRVGPGIAFALGNQVVPYVKQFFVGGPFSIRAWDVRSLGPGTANLYDGSYRGYYSAGDVKLDLNMELRYPIPIISYLKGAVFLDAANIWELNAADPTRRFSTNFLSELAVGTGTGLRLDVELFVIRLDVGLKLLYPYEVDNSKWFFSKTHPVSRTRIGEGLVYNIALGFPF